MFGWLTEAWQWIWTGDISDFHGASDIAKQVARLAIVFGGIGLVMKLFRNDDEDDDKG